MLANTVHLVPRSNRPPMSILNEQFQPRLEKLNQLSRELRAAGVVVVNMHLEENLLVIDEEHTAQLASRFSSEIRGIRSKAIEGTNLARRTVTIRGVDILWFSQLKEQTA